MFVRWFNLSDRVQEPLYFPNDGPIDTSTRELNADGILDILNDESDESEVIDIEEDGGSGKKKERSEAEPKKAAKPEKDEEEGDEPVEGEEEEVDELKELEEELEEPDEEKLELVTPVRRSEILKKYPNVFKDFPYLEKAYYREQQFTEVFPTIDDAKQASQAVKTLENFEQSIMKGDTGELLKAVKSEDQEAFHRVVDNYMVNLWNADQMAYHHVIGNIQKQTVKSMVLEGKRLQNDALINAAAILNQYVFGTSEYTEPTVLSKQVARNPEKDEVQQERQKLTQEKFDSARDTLDTKLSNSIKATISEHIDKKDSMTDYVRRNATREAYEKLTQLIDNDRRFQSLKDKLWEAAFKENFSQKSLDRIRSAYVSKAKTLLPAVIKTARNEALRGLGKKVKDDTEQFEPSGERNNRPNTRNASSSSANRGNDYAAKAKGIPKGMTTAEYLMQD